MLETPKHLHAALKLTIKHFILVMDALGDREMKWLSAGSHWNNAVNEASAYGYTAATGVRMIPTSREISQAEVVASWLTWLAQAEGERPVKRLVKWAHDEPLWRLAERENCSERTIANRIDRSIAAIMDNFGGGSLDLEVVEEKPTKPMSFFAVRPVETETGVRSGSYGKVWIDGIGFMKDGRRIDRGDRRFDLERIERVG